MRFHPGTADVREIAQPWLRSVLQRWVEIRQPRSDKFGRTLRAVILASQALQSRPGGGCDPASLQFGDVNAVVDAFRTATRVDGSAVYSQAFRASLAGEFFALLDFGRQAGMLDGLSGAFARTPAVHRIKVDHGNEDETGKAIPGYVLTQLEQYLQLLGTAGTGKRAHGTGGMQDADREAMYQTIFLLLRDTGRRPEEIAALPRDCLEVSRGDVSLIWDNRKGRRRRRRLPITSGTAQAIRLWQAARDRLDAPAASSRYLFPALTHGSGTPHLPSQYISEAIRAWVAAIPHLEGEGVDAAARPLPFNRSMIFPCAFRHTYAQRHADAGTPVDVLKELMDHRSVSTTMGYYQVSLKRKRAAVRTLAAQAVDKSGHAAPFSSGLAYERSSVAVPFGGCTEPSNVKAGGNACPIRFQCAGCGFYRPDPSYLLPIEQHINDLRADRETARAMDAADFVIAGLTAQIDSYTDIAATMRQRLAALPEAERAEIEEAAAIMRKTRAAGRTILPLLPETNIDG